MLKRIYRLHYPILFDKIHKGINSLKDYCKDALAKIAQLLRELSKALHQGCRFNPRSGNIQEPTNERTGTTNLDISLSFSFSLSLSVSHWVSPLSSFSPKSFFFKKRYYKETVDRRTYHKVSRRKQQEKYSVASLSLWWACQPQFWVKSKDKQCLRWCRSIFCSL